LHAKVYIADDCAAIVTSGNLTTGGLVTNFEYGVAMDEPSLVRKVKHDIVEYAGLGAVLGDEQLVSFCEASDRVREAFRKQTASVAKRFRAEFEKQARIAEDQLIRLRLSGGAHHTVFAKTVLYLLKRHGPLETVEQHRLVQAIHPDLCDDSIDRVIDGQHFGKKWKHAVRTAQQQLKAAGLIELGQDGRWVLTAGDVEP
jgi:phosphatidylserine/phosphatidylglycerophosphate/cardiolipin synthase-like enzyme